MQEIPLFLTERPSSTLDSSKRYMKYLIYFLKNEINLNLHHIVDFACQKTSFFQMFQKDAIGQQMHVNPADTRFDSSQNGTISRKDSIVNNLLTRSKFSICRERASNIRAETVVLCAHIE